MWDRMKSTARRLGVVLLAGGVLAAGGSAAWLATAVTKAATPAPPAAEPKADRITRLDRGRFAVPDAAAEHLGLKTATAAPPPPSPLPPFPGKLELDANTLQRVHARFAGEVVELGTTEVKASASLSSGYPFSTVTRPLRVGDAVAPGQLLAVVWSKDLGEKKSELVDALTKLAADERTLTRQQELYRDGGGPEKSLRDAEDAVKADRNAVNRAEATLRTWRLTDAEVAVVRAEADRLADPKAKRPPAGDWARVEVRAAAGGTVMDKAVAVGDLVDTSADLFRLADLSRLVVSVAVYEDDLPLLDALPKPVRWDVSVPSRPGLIFGGTLERVDAVIDQAQHTAQAVGRVDNPNGALKVGQFVTASVGRPPHPGELAVPAEAVLEDGRESVVFVRPDPAKPEYVRTAVTVARRTRTHVTLAPGCGVKAGDVVVTAGALLLREATDAVPK